MATIRKTITLTDQRKASLKSQIAIGNFTTESELIRDLLRHAQRREAKLAALKAAVQAGLDSSVYESDAFADVRWELRPPPRNG